MSWMLANSYLYVICKDQEQCQKLTEQFENKDSDCCNFELLQSQKEPLRIDFILNDGEVSSDFDDTVIEIDKWLRENFNLSFKGYWWSEIDCQHYRSELHAGEVKDAFLDWLEPYTIEQITKIREYAKKTFSLERK